MTVDLKTLLKRRVKKTREIFIGTKQIIVEERPIIKAVPLKKRGPLHPTQ